MTTAPGAPSETETAAAGDLADLLRRVAARDRSERRAALHDCLRGLDAAGVTRSPRLDPYDRAIVADATYAATIEPPGGSPNGAPSGPPVFLGKLVPVGP
jgi:hypothetical protein